MALEHLTLEKRVCDYILNQYKPDLVLLIDYGTFNLRVAKRLKGSGIKVVHYIPPQVWASRKWRINGIKKVKQRIQNKHCYENCFSMLSGFYLISEKASNHEPGSEKKQYSA